VLPLGERVCFPWILISFFFSPPRCWVAFLSFPPVKFQPRHSSRVRSPSSPLHGPSSLKVRTKCSSAPSLSLTPLTPSPHVLSRSQTLISAVYKRNPCRPLHPFPPATVFTPLFRHLFAFLSSAPPSSSFPFLPCRKEISASAGVFSPGCISFPLYPPPPSGNAAREDNRPRRLLSR